MQSKRQQIIEIIKRQGSATVEELSEILNITSVTVRHHLEVLRTTGMISEPIVKHRVGAGRPHHAYFLTAKAVELFPKRYDVLAEQLLDELKIRCEAREVQVVFEDMGQRLAAEAPRPLANEPAEHRLDRLAEFLNAKGYLAHWQKVEQGFLVHTCNCPYGSLAEKHPELCQVDLALMNALTNGTVERTCHMLAGQESCTYLIRNL